MDLGLWIHFEGKVGKNVEKEYKELEESGEYWLYIKDVLQGDVLYNVLGDFKKEALYMSCCLDGVTGYGKINSSVKTPVMADRGLSLHGDDFTFCGWLSDMILCTQFENRTREEVLSSWRDAR
jgi:hypothetical protein